MNSRVLENPDARRLVVEISSLYVACDDCGHSRTLKATNLQAASELGAHMYWQLCHKIRCGECPPTPPKDRNLTIRPTWLEESDLQTVA
jgi:hypothetical protein